MRSTPLLPASSAAHTSSALWPTAQMTPIPVTTTRRLNLLRSLRVRVDVVHGVLHGAYLLRIFVGDLDLEALLKGHDQLNRIERIGAQVVHERRIGSHLGLIHPQLCHDDLFYAFLYGCHEVSNLLSTRLPGERKTFGMSVRRPGRSLPRRPDRAGGRSGDYFFTLACWSMYVTASCTVRIFSASSSGISISKASSKAITSSTVSSESAPRSSTNEALGVTSASSTPNCSTMICFTRSSTDAMRSQSPFDPPATASEKLLVCMPVDRAQTAPRRGGRTGWWPDWQLLLRLGVLVDVRHGVLHGADLLRILVRDFDLEGLFESHDQFDRVERVGAEVVYKRSAGRHFRFIHAQLLHDDLFHPFFNRSHRFVLLSRTDR